MNPQQESLLRYGTISIKGEINKDTKKYVKECLKNFIENGAPNIMIIINSNGGNHYESMEIFDMLCAYPPGKTTGYVQTCGCSYAAVILQACSCRKMCGDAILKMKQATDLFKIKNIGVEDINKIKKELEACLQEVCLIFNQRSNRSLDFFAQLCKGSIIDGSIITAYQALKLGLIDEII